LSQNVPLPRSAVLPFVAVSLGLALTLAAACGGKVVSEPEEELKGEGGTSVPGPTSATTTTSSIATTTTTTATGTGGEGGIGGAPPIPALVETDYGQVEVGATLAFDVPPGTLGITTVIRPPGSYDLVGVETLAPPAGPPLITDYSIPGTSWQYAWYGITVLGIPQSDAAAAMPPMPGLWQMTLGAPEGGVNGAQVSVWRRQTVDGAFHGGLLDVNVFIAGGATTEGYMSELLAASYSGYAGIELGQVTFHEIDPSFEIIDSAFQLFEALEETAGANGKPALNVIAVSLLTGDLEGAGGVAAGIPGTGLHHGSHASGIVQMVFHDPALDRVVLRHEGGHLAGLFHTTEIEGGFADALDDTPVCPDVEGMLESCPDAVNVMFPYGGAGDAFSPKQERVIQGSSLYRGIVEAGGAPAGPLPLPPPPSPAGAPAPGATVAAEIAISRARADAWREGASARGTSRQLLAALDGAWCAELRPARPASAAGGSDPVRRVDPFAAVRRAPGGDDARTLLALGRDAAAPIQVRQRALLAAGRAAPAARELRLLEQVAGELHVPPLLRAAAIDALRAASPVLLRKLRPALVADADPMVARAAAR
jgi:hypothetical protein